MYIAKRLKEENIAEYVLYLWQVEDLLRANHLDMDELRTNYLAAFKAEGKAEKELEEWYEGLIRMMREEATCKSTRTLWHGSPNCITGCCIPANTLSTRRPITKCCLTLWKYATRATDKTCPRWKTALTSSTGS